VTATPLSLSALSVDILIALSNRADGIAAGELGRILDGAPTSIQNNLRVLTTHGLVQRQGSRYVLVVDEPGVEELVAAGLRLARPEDAIRLVLRANTTVEFATYDLGGFIVGLRARPDIPSIDALERSIGTIRRNRPVAVPAILRFEMDELVRIMHAAVGLRTRIAAALVVKGVVRTTGRSLGVGYPYRPGRTPQNS
jgi:hypothetical protein